MTTAPRYDGLADWYDEKFSAYASEDGTAGRLARRVGPSDGKLILDVGCGTGLHFAALQRRGWQVLGVDLSVDQLRIAGRRSALLARADGCRLPFRDGTCDVVVATFIHTDVDDFAGVLAEVARVLRSGGRFVYVGLHPCYVGPFAVRANEATTRTLTLTAGYGDSRRIHAGSGGMGAEPGVSRRTGAKWLPLAEFLVAFVSAGLRISDVEEFDGVVVPWNLAIEAEAA